MGARESFLIRLAIGLSVLLVMALGVIAIYSVLERDDRASGDAEETPDTSGGGTTTVGRPYPGPTVDIDDLADPLTIGCIPEANDRGYSVLIANRSSSTIDYLVSVRLVVDELARLTSIDVPDLGPGEVRELDVPPPTSGGSIEDCTVVGVQSDRRLLLAAT